jgi:hypothetical protein
VFLIAFFVVLFITKRWRWRKKAALKYHYSPMSTAAQGRRARVIG